MISPSREPRPRRTRLALALGLVLVVLVLGYLAIADNAAPSSSSTPATVSSPATTAAQTSLTPSVTTQHLTTTVTSLLNATQTEAKASSQYFEVTFEQEGACSPPVYVAPWSVTLGNETVAEPSTTALPIPGGGFTASSSNADISSITFSVPDGVYQYTLAPEGAFYQASGTVLVNGSDVLVQAPGPAVACATTHP